MDIEEQSGQAISTRAESQLRDSQRRQARGSDGSSTPLLGDGYSSVGAEFEEKRRSAIYDLADYVRLRRLIYHDITRFAIPSPITRIKSEEFKVAIVIWELWVCGT